MSTFSSLPACRDFAFRSSRCRDDATEVVSVSGELDLATARQLRQLLLGVVESVGAVTITLDISGVSFLDAGSIRVIVEASEAARLAGGVLQIDGAHGLPKRVFGLVGLEHMLAGPGGTGARERLVDGR